MKCTADTELFGRLADVASLTMWLSEGGIPVAAPIPTTKGLLRVVHEHLSLGICPVVDGELLDVDNPAHVIDAGHMLASLHEALAAYPHRFNGALPGRGAQLVHNDFRSANILYDTARISAVLDFDDVTHRARVSDLAKAAVLLGTRYHN